MKFSFEVSGLQIKLQDMKCQDWMGLDVKGLRVDVKQFSTSLEAQLKLKGLHVKDFIHQYVNPNMQYILTSNPRSLLLEHDGTADNEELIEILLTKVDETDPLYKNINLEVDVQFGTLQAVLKPLVLAKVLQFFIPKKTTSDILPLELTQREQKKKEKEDIKKVVLDKANQAQQVGVMSDSILIKVHVRIKSVRALLVHRFTQLPLAELNLDRTEIEFMQRQDEMLLDGSLGNLQLIDMTNYPTTLFEEASYKTIKAVQLIGVKDQKSSLLKIKFRGLQEGSPKIGEDNVSTYVDIKMSQIIINHMQQPVLRLIDYTLQQLLFALTNPECTIDPTYGENVNVMPDLIKSSPEEQGGKSPMSGSVLNQSSLSTEEQSYLLKQLQKPSAMNLVVFIENPQVILKPTQDSKQYLIVDLGDIHVNNKRTRTTERIIDFGNQGQKTLPEGVWVDQFTVVMKDICIFQMREGDKERREVTLPFDFNVKVELFGLAPQYAMCHNHLEFDGQIKINVYMAPMIIQLTHLDYMFLMKCLFHNIAYDDGFDTMIRQKYPEHFKAFLEEQQKKQDKDKQVNQLQLDQGDATPSLTFQMDAENLTAFLKTQGDDTKEDPSVPFFRVTLVMMRIQFVKRNNGVMEVVITTRDLEGSQFKKNPTSLELLYNELPFMGSMTLNQTYTAQQAVNLNGLLSGQRASTSSHKGTMLALATRGMLTTAENRSQVFRFEDCVDVEDKETTYKMKFNLSMLVNGDKIIEVNLADFKLMVHAGPLFEVLALVAMDDPELTPPVGIYIKMLEEEKLKKKQENENKLQQQENKKEEKKQQQQLGGSLKVHVGLKNVIICAPTTIDSNVLAIRGEFAIDLTMGPQKNTDQVLLELEQLGVVVRPGEDIKEAEEINTLMALKLDIDGFEVCICKAQEMAKKEHFRQVRKREILTPIKVELVLTRALILTKDLRNFIDRTTIKAKLSSTRLKVCFKDFGLLQTGITYQLEQMPKSQPVAAPAPVAQPVQIKSIEDLKDLKLEEMKPTDLRVNAELEGFTVVILNDMGNTFTPILDFEMQEVRLLFSKNNIFQTVAFTLPLRLSYYNPRAGVWEPVIEKTGFNVDYYSNNFGGALGGTILTIEQSDNFPILNIVLSTTFFQTLFRTIYLIKKMAEPLYKQVEEEKQDMKRTESAQGILKIKKSESVVSAILEDEAFAQVSPYMIRNLTGYKITCEPLVIQGLSKSKMIQSEAPPPKLVLQNNEQQNIKLSLDEHQQIDAITQKLVSVTVHLGPTRNQKIEDIDFDRIKSKLHQFKEIQIFTQIKLDEVTNSKVLTVSSAVMFINLTGETIMIALKDKTQTTETLMQPHQPGHLDHQTPLPIGYVKSSFSLRFLKCQQFSEELSIDKLLGVGASVQNVESSKTFEVITKDNKFLVIKVVEDSDAKGRFKIFIEAPFKINNSLPKSVYVQMLNERKETTETFKLASSESHEDYHHSHYKRVYMRVLVDGFYWSGEHRLYRDPRSHEDADKEVSKDDCMLKLPLVDGQDNTLSILVYEPWRMTSEHKGCREFVIFCAGYLQNLSPYQILYTTHKDKKGDPPVPVPGQTTINHGDHLNKACILIGPECGQMLSLSDATTPKIYSKHATSVQGVGACQLDLMRDEDGEQKQIYMGGNIQLKICNSKHLLFNKAITIEPRFILVNESEHTLVIRPSQSSAVAVELKPKQRVPYSKPYTEQKDHKFEKIMINMNMAQSEFSWSGDINIAEIGIVYYQLKHNEKETERFFFTCDTREEGCNVFVIFKALPPKQAPYKFINLSKDVHVSIPSLDIHLQHDKEEQIEHTSTAYYAWDEPSTQDKTLVMMIKVKGAVLYRELRHALKPDRIGAFKIFTLKPQRGQNGPILHVALTIIPEGYQKQIIIETASQEQIKRSQQKTDMDFLKNVMTKDENDVGDEEEEKKSDNPINSIRTSIAGTEVTLNSRIIVKVKAISISLMHNADPKKRPAEYLNLSIKNIEMIQLSTEITQTTQIRVQYVNIDNNSQFFVNYPVILTPLKYKAYHLEKYFINVIIMKDTKVRDINLFQNITIEIDPFAVQVEEQFISSMLEFTSGILDYKAKVEEFEKKNEERRSMRVDSSYSEEQKQPDERKQTMELQLDKMHWFDSELPAPSLPTYIDTLIISPIVIQLTFQYRSKASDFQSDKMALFKSIAQGLGVALTNIDEAQLKFTGLKLDNSFATAAGITKTMISHYKDQGMRQILKLLGSLSVLGNPVGLFNNISTGVTDLIEKPVEGFTKGPLEGGLGLVTGAGSLVQHTIAGAFNSVNKITGSVSSGLQALTMDEDYIKERERMRLQKPKHIGQGLGQAGVSLFQGITQGISGVFFKPFEGAKKDGVKGFLKGTLQGLSGLVIKPIAGILDAAAKTTEGIKNTVTYLDDKPNDSRDRNIRPVYGPEGYYTEYVTIDAEGFALINFIKKGQYSSDRFVAAYSIAPDQKDPENKFMFILTLENLFYMSFKTKKKVWIIPVEEFANIDKVPKGVKIQTKTPLKALKNKKEVIVELSDEQKTFVFDQIHQLITMVKYLK